MTRKYNWSQHSKTCAQLDVLIYDNDKTFVGRITVSFVSGVITNCDFLGFSSRPLFVSQEIGSAISKALAAFHADGDLRALELMFDSSASF